jgi:methionyl-tRNA formyltransferase
MSKTILFFGSGPVAAKSLKLLAQTFDIEAVITKPKPSHHKGDFPVITTAEKLGLKILSTADRDALDELFKNNSFSSPVGVVIDYGIIISQQVIDKLPLGIINSHFSLLPQWRGADPISYTILKGDKETGVSLMKIVKNLDEGPLLVQESIQLSPKVTTPELTGILIKLSHKMLVEYLPLYMEGLVSTQPQPGSGSSYSKKLHKEDSILDFTKPALKLEREIRAYMEWPRSRVEVNGITLIITEAHAVAGTNVPGSIYKSAREFGFYTSDGILVIDTLIPAGKKEMSAAAFLTGYEI